MQGHLLLTCFFLIIIPVCSIAQQQDKKTYGPRYYQSYDRQVTTRYYFSRKFTTVILRGRGDHAYTLRYQPNTTLNMGVGATYRWATLNLAYGFGFLNPERGRGKTRYLDLQFHSYGRKISVDVLGQFYRGFYLGPKGNITNNDKYYQRPDLNVQAIGASVQYIFNYNQFSYRAAFLQNEWQQQSAGTWLTGVEMFAGGVRADSSIAPRVIDEELALRNVKKLRFFEFGPNVGYAYTYVIQRHYFITGAGAVSLDVGVNTAYDNATHKTVVGFNPNTLFRLSGGYNSDTWAFNVLFISNAMRLAKYDSQSATTLRTGNVRVNVVYRLKPSKKMREYLKAIDEAKP